MIHLRQNLVLLRLWSTIRDDGMKKTLSSHKMSPFSVLAGRITRCLEMTNMVNTTTSKDDGGLEKWIRRKESYMLLPWKGGFWSSITLSSK